MGPGSDARSISTAATSSLASPVGSPAGGSSRSASRLTSCSVEVRIDATDASHHGIGGHGPGSVLRPSARGYPSPMMTAQGYGAQSMTAPLRDVLVKRPGPAFGRAFDDPAHGFLHAVDLEVARREHEAFVDVLASLGPTVHVLDEELDEPDLVYTFDPLLVTDRGAIPLRPGKPNRAGEPAVLERWMSAAGIPTLGRIEASGTVEGGDTFWLRPGPVLCRTNAAHEFVGPGAAGGAGRR